MDEQPYPRELSTRPFTLVLVSHSHAPPLSPAPDLKFDLRKVSNPPKHTRDACDGRSKYLREHMLASDDFCALLEMAHASIEGKMVGFARSYGDHLEHPEEQSTQLIVGCFCALGKHRSVAFVEELARKQWPDDWDVEVRHREVDQSKGKDKNQRHKQSRKENRRFVGLEPEQD